MTDIVKYKCGGSSVPVRGGIYMLESVMYVLSVSLQISGAAMISLYWLKNKDIIIANEYHKISGEIIPELDTGGKEKEIKINKNNLKDSVVQVWTSRFSFLMMAIGMFVGILGEKHLENLVTIVSVVLLSVFVTVIAKCAIRKMVKCDLENEKYLNMVIQESTPNGTVVFERSEEL